MLACFFRSARGPSPAEEAYVDGVEKSRRTTIKRQRRPIMEARQQPWNPFAGAVSRYMVNVALAEALAYEFERRRWFGFGQTRRLLVGEAKGRARRAGSPLGPRGRRSNPNDGIGTAAAATAAAVDPLVEEEERVSAPAPVPVAEKTWFPPGGYNTQCKPPARITFADRCGPGSLEAFLESVVAARGGGGGGGSTSHDVPGNRWAEIAEAKARRQRYLRDYCPFQSGEEEISAHTAPDDDEQQQEEISAPTAAPEKTTEEAEVIDHAVVKQPAANCPGPEGGDDDATGVRDKQARPVRGTAGYYVMLQEFLKSYQLARKRRTFREKAPLLPVFRRLLPRRKKAQIL